MFRIVLWFLRGTALPAYKRIHKKGKISNYKSMLSSVLRTPALALPRELSSALRAVDIVVILLME
jgi:hypothetical protein